jgi:hexosaminidase
VDSVRALVTAVDVDGLRHGAVTLRQLLVRTTAGLGLRPAFVVDAPRFAWRGLHLDVARSFVPVPTLERVLDLLAGLKMNVLHLHLTDDQGWRIEVPSRPLLTQVSGGTAVAGGRTGFYTAADWDRIQDHAALRGVVVVPEIDMPGHVNAALHAYGELTPTGEPTEAYDGTDIGFSRLHLDLPATAAFVRDVVRDVAAMTRGPYLHVGGDEALTIERGEYSRLVSAIAEQVRVAGKTLVGWQEIARSPLAPGAVVQLWDDRQDTGPVVDAAWQGARVVLSPAQRVYLDMKYEAGFPVGADWAGTIGLRDAYDWEPAEFLPGILPGAITGVEAALWSETVHTDEDLFTLLLPRLAAVAEVAWSVPLRRSWPDFAARVARYGPVWDAAGVPWHRTPEVAWAQATDDVHAAG